MAKNALFLLKYCKNRQAQGAPPPDHLAFSDSLRLLPRIAPLPWWIPGFAPGCVIKKFKRSRENGKGTFSLMRYGKKNRSKDLKILNVNYIMHKTGICTVYVISIGLKLEITTV